MILIKNKTVNCNNILPMVLDKLNIVYIYVNIYPIKLKYICI